MNKSPISILQEICAQSNKPPPNYFIEEIVEHGTIQFLCTCTCGAHKSQGVAANKRDAKTESANKLLAKLYSLDDKKAKSAMTMTTIGAKDNGRIHNYVGDLNEYASTNNAIYPSYHDNISDDLSKGMFKIKCDFLNLHSFGYGPNKKQAKQAAAKEMLDKINAEKPKITTKFGQPNCAAISEEDYDEVIKTFSNLSAKLCTTNRKSSAHYLNSSELICGENLFGTIDDKLTTAELLDQLKSFNVHYEIKTYQLKPLILYIKIAERNLALMETGRTREEALEKLLTKTIRYLKDNYSYSL